jgi:hypothetical protein
LILLDFDKISNFYDIAIALRQIYLILFTGRMGAGGGVNGGIHGEEGDRDG